MPQYIRKSEELPLLTKKNLHDEEDSRYSSSRYDAVLQGHLYTFDFPKRKLLWKTTSINVSFAL